MKHFTCVLLILLAAFIPTHNAWAENSEEIDSISSVVQLDKSGIADITETIVYDFGSNQRRGIYRNIPFVYETGNEEGFLSEVRVLQVQMDSKDIPFQVTEHSRSIQIKIGDPNRTISGKHEYLIRYTLSNVLIDAEDADRFIYDVTGDEWTVPIRRASMTLFSEVQHTSIFCYTGEFRSIDSDCMIAESFPEQIFSNGVMSPGSNMTVEYNFPKGSFTNYANLIPTSELPTSSSTDTPDEINILFILILLLFPLSAFIYGLGKFLIYRRKKSMTIVPQYKPPEGLSPAEIGVLQDDASDSWEMTATLIDLARRGYLKISQTRKKSFFRQAQWKLTLTGKNVDLKDFEQKYIDAIFGGQKEVELHKVDKLQVSDAIQKIDKDLKKQLTGLGHYEKKRKGFSKIFGLFGLPSLSNQGYEKWAEVEGFKQFLSVTDKERFDFHNAPEKNPQQFMEFLPYAIALGVEKKWAKQFEGIDLSKEASWYSSAYLSSFAASDFANSISSFSSSAASNFASGSSSTSGGGFSGGGVGGGGGGSW